MIKIIGKFVCERSMKNNVYIVQFIIFNVLILYSSSPGPQEIVSHIAVLREMKELPLFPELAIGEKAAKVISTTKRPADSPKSQAIPKYTQTEAFLKIWCDIKSEKIEKNETDSCALQLVDLYGAYYKKDLNAYKPLVLAMIDNERIYAEDYVFYHAYKRELGLLFDIYREIFDIFAIQGAQQQAVLVRNIFSLKSQKNIYASANDFIDTWQESDEDFHDTRNPILSNLLLSVNLALFGNTLTKGSGSFHYFITSFNISEVSQFLPNFFNEYAFDKKYLKQIDDLYAQYMKGDGGYMLQIFIPRPLVDTLVYLSRPGGLPVGERITQSFSDKKMRHTDMLSILDTYRNDPFSIQTDLGELTLNTAIATSKTRVGTVLTQAIKTVSQASLDILQARILLIPRFFDPVTGIKIFRFSLTPEKDVITYRKKLKEIVKDMLIEWLQKPQNRELIKNTPLFNFINYLGETEQRVSLESLYKNLKILSLSMNKK